MSSSHSKKLELLQAIIASQQEIATSGLNVQYVMETITHRVQQLTNATGAVVELIEGDEMVYHSVSGSASGQLGLRLKAATSLSGKCVLTGEILKCDDSEVDPRVDREACRKVGARSMIVVPLVQQDRNIGALKVLSSQANTFHEEDVHTLELMAGLITSAMYNANEFAEKQKVLDERTQALQALRDSEEQLRAISEATFEGVSVSRDQHLIEVNQSFLEMFGYTYKEVQGLDAIALTVPKDRDIVRENIRKDFEDAYEVTGLRKDGSTFPLKVKGRVIYLRGKKHRVTAFRDLTDQKQSEAQLRQDRNIAETANRLKSEFLANMSHELRTPLNGVIGLSELLLEGEIGDVNEVQQEYIRDILDCGKHLLRLINDILDLSKIESGKMTLSQEEFTFDQVWSEVDPVVRQLARTKQINVHVESDLANTVLVLDKQKIKQVLFNLVSNAVKFTPEQGAVMILVHHVGDTFTLQVRDTGIGIRQEDMPKLFQEFQQLDSQSNRKYQGTGLGLNLTKKLVELHGGTITVESTLGSGSTFTVALPIAVATTTSIPASTQTPASAHNL